MSALKKKKVSLTSLGLLIISEEDCSFDLNPMETYSKCLSLLGQYYPFSHWQGISPVSEGLIWCSFISLLLMSHNKIYAQICKQI